MRKTHLFVLLAVAGIAFGAVQGENYLPAGNMAPAIEGVAPDGKTYSLAKLAKEKPAFVVFWKQRCPHNAKASALFNSLQKAYGEKTSVIGVVNADSEGAKAWTERFAVNYPLLSDPTKAAIGAYKLRYSITTVQVGTNGKIERVFEGYGAESVKALNEAMAKSAGMKMVEIDFSSAPGTLTWG